MKTLIRALALAGLIAFASISSGGEQTVTSASIKTPALPVFQPKNLGAPKVRVGGGSRGENQSETEL